MTCDELFNQHYLVWAKSAKRSWGKDFQRYRDHIRPAIGQMLLSDITPACILLLQQTLSTSLSAATCNRVIVLIKAAFTWAGRQSITSVHPARGVQLLRENNARQRYFTEDEIRRIFLSADNDTSPVAARYVKLLLLTGFVVMSCVWQSGNMLTRSNAPYGFRKPRMVMVVLFTLTHWRWTLSERCQRNGEIRGCLSVKKRECR